MSNEENYKKERLKLLMWNAKTHDFTWVKYGESAEPHYSSGFEHILQNVHFSYASAFVKYVQELKIKEGAEYTHYDMCIWTEEFQIIYEILLRHNFIKDEFENFRDMTTTVYI